MPSDKHQRTTALHAPSLHPVPDRADMLTCRSDGCAEEPAHGVGVLQDLQTLHLDVCRGLGPLRRQHRFPNQMELERAHSHFAQGLREASRQAQTRASARARLASPRFLASARGVFHGQNASAAFSVAVTFDRCLRRREVVVVRELRALVYKFCCKKRHSLLCLLVGSAGTCHDCTSQLGLQL